MTAPGQRGRASLLERVARYEAIALVLQGGGALGAYQCGVYEGLHEAGIRPNWIAGISIGAINAALIAGNAPEDRVAALRDFWTTICEPAHPLLAMPALAVRTTMELLPQHPELEAWATQLSALSAVAQGQRGFFTARPLPPFAFSDGRPHATSFYDTGALRETLLRLVDFERINHDPAVRLTVGATEIASGNFRYFDSREVAIGPEHVMASGALPPGLPPVEIDGRCYWDGGLVSNTPLEHILDQFPRQDTLAFQVDLWSARGELPQTMPEVLERMKDIQYSSRTRHGTDMVARTQQLRTALADLIGRLPGKRVPRELEAVLAPWLDDRVFNIVHLIYQAKPHEAQHKAYAFGQRAMRDHWDSGRRDTALTLEHPHYFDLPDRARGYAVHDVHRNHERAQVPRA